MSQQQNQATDIQEEEMRISISLPYVESCSENLRGRLRFHKIRPTFYIESTLCILVCKPKRRVAAENKNNIAYEISLLYEAVYFFECKRSLKSFLDEQKKIYQELRL